MLMGNCVNCYYYVRDDYEQEDGTRDGSCHRFPRKERVSDMHFCGEYWNKQTAALDSLLPKNRRNL